MFIGLDEKKKFEMLGDIFRNKIIPLLQEYFFENWDKIRLVLSDNQKNVLCQFVKKQAIEFNGLFGNKDDSDEFIDLQDFLMDKSTFEVNERAFNLPDAYVQIYQS